MRKHSLRSLYCLLLLLLAHLAVPIGAQGQQQPDYRPPYALYRFFMGGNGGYWYSPWYSVGINAGYSYRLVIGEAAFQKGGLYPNQNDGYTPDPAAGLVALHQWMVYQNGRSYTYLSPYLTSQGSGYTYNGVVGYVYPSNVAVDPFGFPTRKMSAWYSQTRGFWYGVGELGDPDGWERPPDYSYSYLGIICRLPTPSYGTAGECSGGLSCPADRTVRFDPPPPPPPPPTCDTNEEQYCYNSGGWWDSSTCTCYYY